MRKWEVWLGLAAFLVAAVAFAGSGRNRTPLPSSPDKMTYVESPTEEAVLALTFSDLRAAFAKADVVALVTADGEVGTRNMAFDPNDPSQPDPNIEIVGRDEQLSIQRYLKGAGPDSVLVTQPYQFVDHSANVRSDYATYVQFSSGQRYLVFLRMSGDGSGRYVGAGEPWRFSLNEGRAQVVTNVRSLATHFPDAPEADVVNRLQDLAKDLGRQRP